MPRPSRPPRPPRPPEPSRLQATGEALLGGEPAHVQPGHRVRNSAPPRVQLESAAHAEPPVLAAATGT
eukprot:14220455-Alexandrium_andersonii.AAC.1